jgi:hypothetical protein
MIILCQTCGNRINQRTSDQSIYKSNEILSRTGIADSDVGKHLLYNGKPFCSDDCIEKAKSKPTILVKEVRPSNAFERGFPNPNRPNGIETWKTERKIGRVRPMRKLSKLLKSKIN